MTLEWRGVVWGRTGVGGRGGVGGSGRIHQEPGDQSADRVGGMGLAAVK